MAATGQKGCQLQIKRFTISAPTTARTDRGYFEEDKYHENAPFCVGFAAETENLRKMLKTNVIKKHTIDCWKSDPQTIGSDFNELLLIDKNGVHKLPRDTKIKPRNLLNHISKIYE